MKIRAPDDVETFTEHNLGSDGADNLFLKEVKEILERTPKVPSEIVVEGDDYDNPHVQLEVLKKFTSLCREEIIPERRKVVDIIQLKSDELKCLEVVQQKDLDRLMITTKELKENNDCIKEKTASIVSKHKELSERLKDAVDTLKSHCKNKSLAERKMAQDLKIFKKKTEDQEVAKKATQAKVNYYLTQVNAQTEQMRKQTKPMYLDRDRAVFMRSNLNSMRENIEQLVQRVKTLNAQMSELDEFDQLEGE